MRLRTRPNHALKRTAAPLGSRTVWEIFQIEVQEVEVGGGATVRRQSTTPMTVWLTCSDSMTTGC
jgi:hypothetical protein